MNKTVFFFPFPFPPPHEPPFLRKVHAAGIPDFEEEKKKRSLFFPTELSRKVFSSFVVKTRE